MNANMDARCRIELLGGLRVQQDERSITRFQTHKTASLLAYLAYHLHPGSHPRELLIELLWPEVEPDAGRHRLSMALSSLRRQLEPPGVPAGAVLQAGRYHVQLNPDAVSTDVAAFEAALRQIPTSQQGQSVIVSLQRTIELYSGLLLPGFYEEWIVREQERLNALYWQAIRRLIVALEDAGDWQQAMEYARRAINMDPLREEAHQELIRLLAEDGQSSAALRQYQELERLLQQALGQPPSPLTRAIAEQSGRMREKGHGDSHRLSPPLHATEPTSTSQPPKAILPLQFTRFFGREEEIARLVETLSPAAASPYRLITLTGIGGSGKTRLAIQTAERLAEAFGDGIWFVPLADLRDPERIPDTILDTLRVPRSPQQEPMDQLVGYLNTTSRPALLLLDNLEHLLSEEPRHSKDGAACVRALLERAPALTCLVTSRQRLALEGEREFPVLPLPTPEMGPPGHRDKEDLQRTPAHLIGFASVQLFVDRVQAVKPDFQVTKNNAEAVAELCARLEGIPLAIELAAARAQVLTPTQMLKQLEARFEFLVSRRRDASERHRTLYAAIAWSYALLSPELQAFFVQLSVFRGSWTLEAAEQVCDQPLALDHLAQLRECSLVLAEASEPGGEMRFRMLETLREYAEEKLPIEQKEALQRRHFHYFLTLADSTTYDRFDMYDRFEREHDNLRAALSWSRKETTETEMDGPHGELGLRFAALLGRFWFHRGYVSEGRQQLADSLACAGADRPPVVQASALNETGLLALAQGDFTEARTLFEEALAIRRELADNGSIAEALMSVGIVAVAQSDFTQARARFEESMALYQEIGHRGGIAQALHNLSLVVFEQGDVETARVLAEQSLAIWQELGVKGQIPSSLFRLGRLAAARGDLARAKALYEECLKRTQELGDSQDLAGILHNLGNVVYYQSDHAAARKWYEESLAICRETGNRFWEAINLRDLGVMAFDQGDGVTARILYTQSLALQRMSGDKLGAIETLEAIAELVAARATTERAARLFGAVAAVREQLGTPRQMDQHPAYDRCVARVLASMDAKAFDAAWASGSKMTLEQAIAYALEEAELPSAMNP